MKKTIVRLTSCIVTISILGIIWGRTVLAQETPVALPRGEKADTLEGTREKGLKVEEYAFCENIEERQPIGIKTTFPKDVGKVYLWTNIVGAEEPTTITHIWYYGKKKMAEISLKINYVRNRTWSYKTILPQWTGDWYVEMVDSQGNLLEKVTFTIAASAENELKEEGEK